MIVYQAHNPISNKFYVGKTIKPIWVRRKRHAKDADRKLTNSLFHKAIRKYGIDIFDWVVLHYADSIEEMNFMEQHWIKLIKECGNKVYNLRPGGDGGSYSGKDNPRFGSEVKKETRNKISESLKKYYQENPGTMVGRKGSLCPSYGRNHSEEAKKKISKANKGRLRPDMVGTKNLSSRKILCVTTNEVFEMATDASKKYSVNLSSIIKCCRGKQKTVGGKIYKYAEPGVFGWTEVG